MFSSHYLLLLLFHSFIFSISDSSPSNPFSTTSCGSTWVCFVNAACRNIQSDDALVELTEGQATYKCRFIARIRKVNDEKHLVILTYIIDQAPLNEYMSIEEKHNNVWDGRFGCAVKNDKLVPLFYKEKMEMNEFLSHIDTSVTPKVYTCAGYIKGSFGTLPNMDSIRITRSQTDQGFPGSSGAALTIKNAKYKSCDQLAVNSHWDDGYLQDFLDKKKIYLPLNDEVRECDESTHGLYYKRFVDVPAQPITRVYCVGDRYTVVTSEGKKEVPDSPFLLFCAHNVNTKCDRPSTFNCGSCDNELKLFEAGEMYTPARLTCPHNSFKVKYNYNDEKSVVGEAVCKGRTGKKEEAVWTIQTMEEHTIEMTSVACDEESTCWNDHPLDTICREEDEKCTVADITQKDAFCPKGTTVRYHDGSHLVDTKTRLVSCDKISQEWRPHISTNAVTCYFNENRQPREEERSWTDSKKRFITYAVLCSFLIIFSFVLILLYFFIIRRRLRQSRAQKDTESNRVKSEESSEAMKNQSKGRKYEENKLAARKKLFPGVDEKLLKRENESADLSFDNLSIVRPDYICEALIEEFIMYSKHERLAFINNNHEGLGRNTNIEAYLELFIGVFQVETDPSILHQLIAGVRMVSIALKLKKWDDMRKRVMRLIGLWGRMALDKYQLYPREGEDEERQVLRSVAYYALLYAGDKKAAMLSKMQDSMLGVVTPSLRRLAWTSVAREKNGARYSEITEIFTKELEEPTKNDCTTYGTKKEDLIYALCSCPDHSSTEPIMTMLLQEPQFTVKEVMRGFAAMVRDFDDTHETAKSIFMERQNLIKAKIPVKSAEYKEIFKMYYQFAVRSPLNDDWFCKYIDAEETYNQEERKELSELIKMAHFYNEKQVTIHRTCYKKKKGTNLFVVIQDLVQHFKFF